MEWKEKIVFTYKNQSFPSLSIWINFNLTEHMGSLTFYIVVQKDRNFQFPLMFRDK